MKEVGIMGENVAVLKYKRERFSPLAMALTARSFAPRSLSPEVRLLQDCDAQVGALLARAEVHAGLGWAHGV